MTCKQMLKEQAIIIDLQQRFKEQAIISYDLQTNVQRTSIDNGTISGSIKNTCCTKLGKDRPVILVAKT